MTTTLDPANKATNITLSNGNLTWRKSVSNADNSVRVIDSITTGKYYCEAGIETSGDVVFGIIKSGFNLNTLFPGGADGSISIGYQSGGTIKINNVNKQSMDVATTNGQRIALAIDMDNQRFWAKVIGGANGFWNNGSSNDPATNVGGISFSALGSAGTFPVWVAVSTFLVNDGGSVYFAKSAWSGSAPTGFVEIGMLTFTGTAPATGTFNAAGRVGGTAPATGTFNAAGIFTGVGTSSASEIGAGRFDGASTSSGAFAPGGTMSFAGAGSTTGTFVNASTALIVAPVDPVGLVPGRSLNRLTDGQGDRLVDNQGNYLATLELFPTDAPGAPRPRSRKELVRPPPVDLEDLRREDAAERMRAIVEWTSDSRQADLAMLLLLC